MGQGNFGDSGPTSLRDRDCATERTRSYRTRTPNMNVRLAACESCRRSKLACGHERPLVPDVTIDARAAFAFTEPGRSREGS